MCPWPGATSGFTLVYTTITAVVYNSEWNKTIQNEREIPVKALSSPEIPVVFRSVSPSSPPLLQPSILHPPRSQCQTPKRGIPEETMGALPSPTADLSTCPRPKKNIRGYPLSVSVWSPRDGGHRAADTERSASTPPPSPVRRRRNWQVITIYITHGNWN